MFQRDLRSLLLERRYHSIDIDPFGSPVYFFDAAVRSVYNKGIIACTATDTAALCGVFPQVCYRRYAAWPLHGPSMHEIGLRILLGCLCREAAKYDRGIEPLLCYTTDHYMRLYVQIHNGKSAANASMAQYSSILAKDVPLSQESTAVVGPLWLGKPSEKNSYSRDTNHRVDQGAEHKTLCSGNSFISWKRRLMPHRFFIPPMTCRLC